MLWYPTYSQSIIEGKVVFSLNIAPMSMSDHGPSLVHFYIQNGAAARIMLPCRHVSPNLPPIDPLCTFLNFLIILD